jgi:hypothetical protein
MPPQRRFEAFQAARLQRKTLYFCTSKASKLRTVSKMAPSLVRMRTGTEQLESTIQFSSGASAQLGSDASAKSPQI